MFSLLPESSISSVKRFAFLKANLYVLVTVTSLMLSNSGILRRKMFQFSSVLAAKTKSFGDPIYILAALYKFHLLFLGGVLVFILSHVFGFCGRPQCDTEVFPQKLGAKGKTVYKIPC